MKEPKHFESMLTQITKAIKTPVTVKFRTGWSREEINAVEIAKIAEGCGAAAVTVHGRTRDQMYAGEIDYDTLLAVRRAVNIPFIANGGIFTLKDAQVMFERTGCDHVMVSRGAMGNPWLFEEIETNVETDHKNNLEGVRETLLEHAELMRDYYGDEKAAMLLRRVSAWYLKGLSGSSEYKEKLHRNKTYEGFARLINEFFSELTHSSLL